MKLIRTFIFDNIIVFIYQSYNNNIINNIYKLKILITLHQNFQLSLNHLIESH